ncbi:MAG: tRNA (adenosine(37)-N6)-threonylcarbamoyltransferase complex ATPase subunit type 1 TsaE [Ferruginibacter sp.]
MDSNFDICEIDKAAADFLVVIKEKKLFAFHGAMGAGKTTFIGAICRQLNVLDSVSSPTYSIINEYYTTDGKKVYHVDLYRLEGEHEAIDAGVEEIFFSGDYCFVEWPEKAAHIFPPETIHCYLKSIDDKTRKLAINL